MVRNVNRSAWAQRLLGVDHHMRIRVAMTAVSALLSAVCGGLVMLLAYAGFARVDLSLIWIITLVLFNLAVLVCIRTGWTLSLDDPALTQLQIRYAILSNAAGYALLGEARGITPVILSLVLMFGIFNLSARQMLANLLLSLLCFGIATVVVFWMDAPGHNAVLELAYGVMIVLVLGGSTFVGLRIQHVRQRLKRQKHALAAALARIHHLAAHDDLTGLVNRRRMTELLAVERERCDRSGRPLVLALLDLDLFKRVNDQQTNTAMRWATRCCVRLPKAPSKICAVPTCSRAGAARSFCCSCLRPTLRVRHCCLSACAPRWPRCRFPALPVTWQ